MADESIQSRLASGPGDVVHDLIFKRRSIRKYKDQPLPEAWIEAMLHCALQAPSPSNRQPVRFVRIQSERCKSLLAQALVEGQRALLARHRDAGGPARLKNRINAYRRYSEFMFAAPLLLAVGTSTETVGFVDHLASGGLKPAGVDPSADLDMTVGLALQGLMLKAQAMGVGSCILTAPLVFIDNVEDLIGLEKVKIKCFLTLGLPDETPRPPGRISLDAALKVV